MWKSFGRGCDLKDVEAAGRWMKTGEYAELHDRAVKAQGRSEALTNARKRRKKTKVLLDKPHARDGKDRTGAERQALGSEFEFGSQASGGTSSVNTAPAGLSHRGRTQQRSAAAEVLRQESGTGLTPQQILDWQQQRERKQLSNVEVFAAEHSVIREQLGAAGRY